MSPPGPEFPGNSMPTTPEPGPALLVTKGLAYLETYIAVNFAVSERADRND